MFAPSPSMNSTHPFRPVRASRLSRSIAAILGVGLALPAASHAEEAERLSPVVVSASGFEQALDEAPASITIITREELQQRRVTSLAEALSGLGGINIAPLDARDGKTGNQNVSVRGLPAVYTLVLIDGVRQNPMGNITPNSFNDSQSVFIPPVAAIERIEVIRGPMSTLYGSDALGGVINIITRRPSTSSWTANIDLSHTFQGDSDFGDKTAADVYASGPIATNKVSAQFFGRFFDRDASDIRIPGVEYPRPVTADTPTMGQNPVGADIYTLGGELLFTPNDSHDISLGFKSTRQEYDNRDGDVGALHRTGNPATSACNTIPAPNFCRGYEQELNFDRDQVTLGYVGQLGIGMLETRVTRDSLETKGRTIPLGSGLDPAVEGSPRELKLDTDIVDARLLTSAGDHMFTLGGQYIDAEMKDGLWGGASNSMSQWSLFVEDEWRITHSFTLTAGLRYDDNDYFDGRWSPRLYGVWNVTDAWIIKGGVATGFRTPFLEQMTDGIIGYGNQGSVPLFGNPNLEPETSRNYEIAALYRPNGRLAAQLTVFRNDLEDLVERGTGANAGQDLNVGESRLQGAELGLEWSITGTVSLSGNYTYIDSEVRKTQLDTGSLAQLIASKAGDPFVSVPDHMANAQLNWRAMPALDTFLRAFYRSEAFRPRNFHEPQNGGNGQGRVEEGWRDSNIVLGDFKGYTLFDLGATYRVRDNIRLTGVIQNLFDKDFNNYVSYTRCTNAGCTGAGVEAFSNRYNSILEGRNFYVSVNLDF